MPGFAVSTASADGGEQHVAVMQRGAATVRKAGDRMPTWLCYDR